VLLKAIEEPPARTVWVLCAPSADDVAVTIRSRCRVVAMRTPDPAVVARLLVERDGIEPELARECALAAQSHIGVARRLARDPAARARRDQVLALATEVRGVGDAAERAALLAALGVETGTIPPALRAQVRELEEDQKRRSTRTKRDVLDRAMTDLMSFYRDVASVQLGAVDSRAADLVNVSHEGRVRELARRSSLDDTMRCLDALATARERLASNVQPLLAIEALVVALRPSSR
jgi:DNA polymerase-3 subunit delta'